LINMGAEYLQGHLFSKALAPEMIRSWLRDRELAETPKAHAQAV
jgi:EAL domain-containing protein (putative c-di-GMP-specific phosphodiesterase class I)